MNMFHQGSDGSLMVISAKANVHWSPLEDEQIWRGPVVIVLEQLRVFKKNNANTVEICQKSICIKWIHTHSAWNK